MEGMQAVWKVVWEDKDTRVTHRPHTKSIHITKRKKQRMEIYKEFGCESAHRLPNVPEGHKCGRLHGHSFRIQVWVRGEVGSESGWVMDYAELKEAFEPVFLEIDHHYLNEIEGLRNPTSENLCRWLWERLSPSLGNLSRVVVNETCTSGCVYEGEGS